MLRNEGADVAAHDMIRRHQPEAEGMERLSAEYLTLATLAQAERWDALLVRSGLTDAELEAVRASEAHGPLLAAFREAEARGLDVEAAFPQLVARRSLADAADVAAVLHGRVDRWTQAAGGRRRMARQPHRRADPEGTGCHRPRDGPGVGRAGHRPWKSVPVTLADQAIEAGDGWVQRLGSLPSDPARRARWVREVSTIAAYRDRWHITEQRSIGAKSDVGSTEQMSQRRRALAAAERAVAISHDAHGKQASPAWEPQMEVGRGVEL